MPTINPTVGRVVLFQHIDRTFAAIVAYVHSPGMLNIAYFDENGVAHNATSVPLIQEGDERPQSYFCEWMPYQKGQAAKTEALEKRVAVVDAGGGPGEER